MLLQGHHRVQPRSHMSTSPTQATVDDVSISSAGSSTLSVGIGRERPSSVCREPLTPSVVAMSPAPSIGALSGRHGYSGRVRTFSDMSDPSVDSASFDAASMSGE